MLDIAQLKLFAGILAVLFAFVSYLPYLQGMFAKTIQPHPYTWLIWTITTGTAALGVWHGGGGYGAFPLLLWTLLTCMIFFLSLKYGTKNITTSDIALLFLALVAILLWWQFHAPLLSILMITGIDALGYLPTFRKSFAEPWSESILSWALFTLTAFFGLLALTTYNFLTAIYLTMSASANVIVIAICLARRKSIPKPSAVHF